MKSIRRLASMLMASTLILVTGGLTEGSALAVLPAPEPEQQRSSAASTDAHSRCRPESHGRVGSAGRSRTGGAGRSRGGPCREDDTMATRHQGRVTIRLRTQRPVGELTDDT